MNIFKIDSFEWFEWAPSDPVFAPQSLLRKSARGLIACPGTRYRFIVLNLLQKFGVT